MSQHLSHKILFTSLIGAALSLNCWQVEALVVGTETPEKLDLTFNSDDLSSLSRDGYGLNTPGALTTLYDGQFWKLTGQVADGYQRGLISLYPSYIVPPPFESRQAVFGLQTRYSFLDAGTEQASYLAKGQSSPYYDSINCQKGSSDCVFFELQGFPPYYSGYEEKPSVPFEFQGFYQPVDTVKSVPEPSTEVGSLVGLTFVGVWTAKKRFSRKKRISR